MKKIKVPSDTLQKGDIVGFVDEMKLDKLNFKDYENGNFENLPKNYYVISNSNYEEAFGVIQIFYKIDNPIDDLDCLFFVPGEDVEIYRK